MLGGHSAKQELRVGRHTDEGRREKLIYQGNGEIEPACPVAQCFHWEEFCYQLPQHYQE